MNRTVLHINSSGRIKDSVTRQVGDQVIAYLQKQHPGLKIDHLNLTGGVPFISAEWISANFTDNNKRTTQQEKVLHHSAGLVEQINQADYVVIGSPIYNFSVPAVLKAWVDQIARAKLTFKYTSNGPVGLMQNKKAILVMASGGVTISSELDFATPYLQQIMHFIGIHDLTVIDANGLNDDNFTDHLRTISLFPETDIIAEPPQELNHHA